MVVFTRHLLHILCLQSLQQPTSYGLSSVLTQEMRRFSNTARVSVSEAALGISEPLRSALPLAAADLSSLPTCGWARAHLLPLRSDLSLGCASGKVCEGRLRQHVHSGWCQAVACGSVWTVPLGASSPGAPNTVALRVSEAGWGQGWDRCPRAGLMVSAHTRAVHRQRWVWPAGWLFLTGQRTRMTLKVFNHLRELPGGPVVKILYFHPEDAGLIPDWGTKIPEAVKHGQKVINI